MLFRLFVSEKFTKLVNYLAELEHVSASLVTPAIGFVVVIAKSMLLSIDAAEMEFISKQERYAAASELHAVNDKSGVQAFQKLTGNGTVIR